MTSAARLARRARRKAARSSARAKQRVQPVAPDPQEVERRQLREALAALRPLPKWHDPSLAQDEDGAIVIMDAGRPVAWMSADLASQVLQDAVLVEDEGQAA